MSTLQDLAREVLKDAMQGKSPEGLVGCYRQLHELLDKQESTPQSIWSSLGKPDPQNVRRLSDTELDELRDTFVCTEGMNAREFGHLIMDACNIPKEVE